jgi:RecQ family ATP-dependent DNA helicase
MSSDLIKTIIKSKNTFDNCNYYQFDEDDRINNLMSTQNILLKSNKIKLSKSNLALESNSKSTSALESNSKSTSALESNSKSTLALESNSKVDKIIETFIKFYPNKTIKPLQYQIIKSICEKSDTIGILPTGYGKSLCYQLPYFLNPEKVIIVVSPLISLMEDQKTKLEKLNIPVACFHSNVGRKKKQEIKEELLSGELGSKLKYLLSDECNKQSNIETDNFIDDENEKKINKVAKIKLTKSKSVKMSKIELNKISQDILPKNLEQEQQQEQKQEQKRGIVLFLTPEYLIGCEKLIKLLASQDKLSLVAMDEAHCISTWGHDFRPDYQGLYRIKEWVGEYNIPLLALTATATSHVEEDIKNFLQLSDPKVYKTSFDRPNLIISVKPKPKEFKILLEILDEYIKDFSIVYCKTRDKAEQVSEFLKENDYNVDVYHAGLSANLRQEIQEKFANKKLNIIVATIAFGMGIDQDVHLVVHWGCPSDMESYYQEIGRAGRDGIESKCIMFYDKDDFRLSRYFLKSHTDLKYKRFKDEQISKMERYCLLNQCRRKIILTHFGEELIKHYTCSKCDNCQRQGVVNTVAMDNLMFPIFIIAKTIFQLKCKLGTNKICLVLRGSKSKTIIEISRVITFGLLKELTDEQVKHIINIMVINGYLKEKTIANGFGTVLETTSKLVMWYAKICHESNTKDTYKLSKDLLTFDNLNIILMKNNNKLDLNIPIEYNHITNIKFKTTLDTLLDDFADELSN